MASTTRITVTLPTELVEEIKRHTDNVSGYVAEAVARQIRRELLATELEQYQQEFGAFTEEELAEARAELGAGEARPGADAA
ncbi:post-segregation antitoxin (ccd killing protein) [Streptacidiphilus sp. MAP12-33]|uniref:type II toxin-antitoxin system CcdA family antitoxin n=1 Tax=Streptacidiphilus sp. MAP12-33 TaxID=3156266 RepID=UPI003514B6FD